MKQEEMKVVDFGTIYKCKDCPFNQASCFHHGLDYCFHPDGHFIIVIIDANKKFPHDCPM